MSFTTAQKIFEQVQAEALNQSDQQAHDMAAGFAELTKALCKKIDTLEAKIKALEKGVAALR